MTADEAISLGSDAAHALEDNDGLSDPVEVINHFVPGLGDRIVDAFGQDLTWAFSAGLTLGWNVPEEEKSGS